MRRIAYAILVCTLFLAGCGQATSTPAGNTTSGAVVPVFAVSELVVGENRLALGLIQDNSPINDPGAKIHLRFFDRSDTSAQAKIETDTTYYGEGLPAALYVAYPTFDKAGEWDVVFDVTLTGQSSATTNRQRIRVSETSAVPNVGDQAVSVKTPTEADTPADQLSSGGKPNLALYQISLDEALKSGKPTAVLFATPGYCRTAMCGPNIEVLGQLQEKFGDKVNFIHVEVYSYPFDASFKAQSDAITAATKEQRVMTETERTAGFSQGMAAWKLATEPWLFLIGSDGVIQKRYEGGITVEELTPVVEQFANS